MKKIVLIGGALTFWAACALAEPSAGLVAVVQAALAHNAGMKAAEAKVREASAAQQEAESSRFPVVSARSQFTRSDNPVFVFGSLLEQGRFGPQNFAIDSLNHPNDLNNVQSGVDLNLPLFTGFEITSRVHQSEYALRQARMARDGAALQLRYQAAVLYDRLILMRDLLKNLDERLAASDQEVADAKRLKERGLVFGSDFYAAQAIASGLKAWRAQVSAQQASALRQLTILTGQSGWPIQESSPPDAPASPSLEELQKIALQKRPDLLVAAAQVSVANESLTQAKRSLLPKIQAFASVETNTNDFSSNPTDHAFGVAAKLPFGDPGYLSRRSATRAASDAAQESAKDLEDSIRMEVSQAYETYTGAVSVLPISQETSEEAAKSLDLFRPLYRSGRQSILEVLRAEEALARAKAGYLEALFNVQASYLALSAATGSLDEKTINDLAQRMAVKP